METDETDAEVEVEVKTEENEEFEDAGNLLAVVEAVEVKENPLIKEALAPYLTKFPDGSPCSLQYCF